MEFLIMLYFIVGMSIFAYRLHVLKSLGLLELVIDTLLEDVKDKMDIDKGDIPISRSSLLILLGVVFIVFWPVVLLKGN